jgi:hypothetical protein
VRAILAATFLVGCRALPPAPVVPFHASTAPEAIDEVTVSLVIGIVMQGLGGAGLGSAIRVEQQVTDRTALGGELALGWIDADGDKMWMFALRGYGQSTPRAHDWVALTYSAGFSVLTTGMVSLQFSGGGALAHPNDYVVPYVSLGAAAAFPILDGRAFGHLQEEPGVQAIRERHAREAKGGVPYGSWVPPQPPEPRLKSEFYIYGSLGTVVPLGDTGNALSLDLGAAHALRDGNGTFIGLTLADTQH